MDGFDDYIRLLFRRRNSNDSFSFFRDMDWWSVGREDSSEFENRLNVRSATRQYAHTHLSAHVERVSFAHVEPRSKDGSLYGCCFTPSSLKSETPVERSPPYYSWTTKIIVG